MDSCLPRELKDMTDWPHKGPRATLLVLQSIHGLVVAPTTHHDLWQQRSGVHLEAAVCWQHKVSNPGPRSAVRSPQCDQRRFPGTGQSATGDDRTSSQAQSESSVFFWAAPNDRPYTVRRWEGVTTKDLTAHMAEIAEKEARMLTLYFHFTCPIVHLPKKRRHES